LRDLRVSLNAKLDFALVIWIFFVQAFHRVSHVTHRQPHDPSIVRGLSIQSGNKDVKLDFKFFVVLLVFFVLERCISFELSSVSVWVQAWRDHDQILDV